MIYRAFVIFIVIGFSCLYSLRGQSFEASVREADTVVLEEISIHALPFGEQYKEATGSIHLIGEKEIVRHDGIDVSSLYNTAPGVQMVSGALNTNKIVIRGVGSRTPYNSNRIRAYLDDIPLTTGDGISTLEDLDPVSLGSIEILKGPSSALYGSGLGGIVRLNSPYPKHDGFGLSLLTETGSFNTQKYGLKGNYRNKKMAITGGFIRSSTDGYRDNSAYTRHNAFMHGVYFHKRHTLYLTFSLVNLYAEIPSSINENDFQNNPEKAGGRWGDIGGYEEYLKTLTGVKLESKLSDYLTNHLIIFSTWANPYERRPFNILDDGSFNVGVREYVELQKSEWKVRAGLEYFHENYNWKVYETLAQTQGELLGDYSERRKYINGFALAQWRPSDRWLLDAGLNLNLLSYDLKTIWNADASDQSGAYTYAPVLSPRLGISYAHSKETFTYASAGHGFSAPSLEETLMPEGNINTSLKPETGWNIEAGNRGSLLGGMMSYDLAVYSVYLQNILVTERLEEDVFVGVNAGTALNSGLEIMVKTQLHPNMSSRYFNSSLSVSYTLSRNVFIEFIDEGTDYSGNHLPGIPSQVLHTTLTSNWKRIELSLNYNYTGSQWMTDANDKKYNAYQLVNLRLAWDHAFKKAPMSIGIHGSIRNLFNTEHASMILINAPSFGGPPRSYYPGPPRQFNVGIHLTFD